LQLTSAMDILVGAKRLLPDTISALRTSEGTKNAFAAGARPRTQLGKVTALTQAPWLGLGREGMGVTAMGFINEDKCLSNWL